MFFACLLVDLPDRQLREIMALVFPKTLTEEEIPLSVELDTLPPADKERLLKTKKELSRSARHQLTCCQIDVHTHTSTHMLLHTQHVCNNTPMHAMYTDTLTKAITHTCATHHAAGTCAHTVHVLSPPVPSVSLTEEGFPRRRSL